MKNTESNVVLAEVIQHNDELKTLKALQMKVAQTLDSTTSARDISALSKQLREITERITDLGGADYDDEISRVMEEYRDRRVR